SGTAEPGSTVTVIVDGASVGTTTATAAGTWTLTPATALADGSHTVRATAADALGNTSPSSNTNTFTVDTTAPVAPVVITPVNGSTINDNTPTYSGTAEAGSTVAIIVDGAQVGTTTATAAGTWSFTPTTGLLNGTHTVKATATDAVGNTSPDSNTNTFIVDATPPAAPVVLTPANGAAINDNTPVYSGTAEAGSLITVIVDGAAVGTTTADGAGNWSFTPATALADGTHTVKATAADATGNVSPDSNTNTFTVDTTALAPVVLTPANGAVLTDNTPTYSGTAEAGNTVTVIVDGAVVGTVTADGTGTWSFTPTTALAEGTHTVRATATDPVGNTSPDSNTNTFTVDTTPPAAPVLVAPANNSETNDTTPTFTGTAEPNVTVTVFLDGAQLGTTTADAAGNWTFTPATPLAQGTYDASAMATDAAGNTSPSSNINRFTIDTTVVGIPVVTSPVDDEVTSDNTPTFTGTADANNTVMVMLNGTQVGTTTADAAGNWSFTPTDPLQDGPYAVVAVARDARGRTSLPSATVNFTVDTLPPDTSIVTRPADETDKPDATFTFGSTESEVTYECSLDGAAFTACSASATFEDLALGEHTLQVRARDAAGNVDPTPASATWTVVPRKIDRALLGSGCAASGGSPSSLAMMGLAVLSALLARRRQR
ncbi:MAG TPA: Ig-like domain-containing protein, partial [Myxococcaceae bacterium]